MYHVMQDPHPGRCHNYRTDPNDPYGAKSYRCVRMENHVNACRFDIPKPLPAELRFDHWSGSVQTYTTPTPQPWVEPPDPNPQGDDSGGRG